MFLIYKLLINLIFFFSPIILIFRLLKGKEDFNRFREKFGFYTKKRLKGRLIWFHGASVGEIKSVIPLIEKFEKNNKIKQVLVTSNTLSSSTVLKKYRFKKTVHQFFPIDCNFISKKFLKYWKPSKVFFIDSEIWPNTINNLYYQNIPIILLNGRITKKTFKRWLIFSHFAKSIFYKFNLCLSSSIESKNYLTKLGAKKVQFIGNLKFSHPDNEFLNSDKNLEKFIKSKTSWCASSTHFNEEKHCGLVHHKLKKKYKNLLTIIIPRHVDRADSILEELNKMKLKVHLDEPKKTIDSSTDIYLVNSYGKTKLFYKMCKNIFMGGSLIDHGGQNPLEAVRFGCNILHGPKVANFKEIYGFLKAKKLSTKVNNQNHLSYHLKKILNQKNFSKKIVKRINLEGNKILKRTYNIINF